MIDQIFKRESGGACASREFPGHLAELTFPFSRIFFQLLVRNESSGALMGLEQAAEFEFAISSHDGVGIDLKVDGELANGGKLVSGGERSGGDTTAHLIDELAVDWDAAVQVNAETWRRGSVVPSHAC